MEIIFKQYIKPYIKPFFILFVIYCIAMLSIWRYGVSYIDDLRHAVHGTRWENDFNRYSQMALASILNVDMFKLTDISPLPQIVAMTFLSITGVMVTYIFCNRKIRYLPLMLTVFIGLSPFTVGCWPYKIEAPGFALAFLSSIAPMLFWCHLQEKNDKKSRILFLAVSIVCLMVMWGSYQAGNGIYIVMTLGLAFRDFLEGRKLKEIFKNIALFAVPYIVAALIFRYALPAPTGYRETDMWALSDMSPGVLHNTADYVRYLYTPLRVEWGILIIFMLICFFASLLLFSKRRKFWRLLDVAVGAVFVLVSIPASYGAYLMLQNPPMNPRTSMGIGPIMVIIGVITCRNLLYAGITNNENDEITEKSPADTKYKIFRFAQNDNVRRSVGCFLTIPALALIYSCVVFSLALGNALADQERWGNFRVQALLEDFSHVYPDYGDTQRLTMQVSGKIGLSAVAAHVNSEYPITEYIINHQQEGLGGYSGWALYKLQDYYKWDQNFSAIWEDDEWDYSSWEVKLDTYYHTIRESDDGRVHVLIKN